MVDYRPLGLSSGQASEAAQSDRLKHAGVVVSDNTATAFEVVEGTNQYVKVETTNGSEKISLGNSTTNPKTEILGSGDINIPSAKLAVGSSAPSDPFEVQRVGASGNAIVATVSNSGQAVNVVAANTSNTDGSDATLAASVGGTSGGDALLVFNVTGGKTWVLGADNSDDDEIRLSEGGDIAAGHRIRSGVNSLRDFEILAPTARAIKLSLEDNLATALEAMQGSDSYLKITTTNASEKISLGNATTNPGLEHLGSGAVVLANGTLDVPAGTSLKIGGAALTTANFTAANMDAILNGSQIETLHTHGLPVDYIQGCRISNNSVSPASKVDIESGKVRAIEDTDDIVVASTLTADIAVSGANGLDTGVEAADTWYSVWVIKKSSDGTVASLLSISETAPTMPSGYDLKRRVGWVRNNSVSDFWSAEIHGAGRDRRYHWLEDTNSSPFRALSSGGATSWTDVDLSVVVPPSARAALLTVFLFTAATTGFAEIRKNGSTQSIIASQINDSSQSDANEIFATTDAAQIIEYEVSHADLDFFINVIGFLEEI